jgi:hypothetical protein
MGIDIRMIGDKELEKLLRKLPDVAAKAAVRPALRKSAKRLKAHVIHNLSGAVVKPHTGAWLAATIAAKVGPLKRSRVRIGTGWDMPTRAELGIDPKDTGYYPTHVEFGYTRNNGVQVPGKSPIRSAVNDHAAAELKEIGDDIGKGIVKQAKKLGRRIA